MKGFVSALVAALVLVPIASLAVSVNNAGHQSPFTVRLNAVAGSGELGGATFSQAKDPAKTVVWVHVTGEPAGAVQPAHLHTGSCASPGAITNGLSNVVGGTSKTILSKPLAWFKNAAFIIVIHKSATQLGIYRSCGTHSK